MLWYILPRFYTDFHAMVLISTLLCTLPRCYAYFHALTLNSTLEYILRRWYAYFTLGCVVPRLYVLLRSYKTLTLVLILPRCCTYFHAFMPYNGAIRNFMFSETLKSILASCGRLNCDLLSPRRKGRYTATRHHMTCAAGAVLNKNEQKNYHKITTLEVNMTMNFLSGVCFW